jgi:hypothetical protein
MLDFYLKSWKLSMKKCKKMLEIQGFTEHAPDRFHARWPLLT